MEQEREAQESSIKNSFLTTESEPKPLKVKIIELKGKDEQLYSVIFNLLKDSIMIEAYDMNDISSTKYMNNLSLDNFQKLSHFFRQFEEIEEIYTLLEDMQQTEFMITKNSNKEIEFILLIEIRKKINEIKIYLEIQKNDINKIIYNLCEKVKELKILKELKEEIKNNKDENKGLKDEISVLKKSNENLENLIKSLNERFDNIIKEDNQKVELLKEESKSLNEKLDNKIKDDKQIINKLNEENKSLNEKLDNKIKEDNQIINQLKEENKALSEQLNNKIKNAEQLFKQLNDEIKSLKEKFENMNKGLELYKNENKNNMSNINNNIEQSNKKIQNTKTLVELNKKYIDNYNMIFNINDKIINEFYESINYLINNKISIDSNIIKNNFELAQINNGIKHQLNKNIQKLNLLYRCSRDGDSISNFHSHCDNHPNLLVVVETSENRKFGGFTSVNYHQSLGYAYDDKAFIFSLNNRENYYIIKGKYAVNGSSSGINFGQNTNTGSEFHLQGDSCLVSYNSYDDTGNNNCYDYGGRKHVLAGKYQFVVSDYEVFQLSFTN